MDQPVIALISAVPASIPPVRAAFAEGFPHAILWNLLDDRLLEEADQQGGLTPRLQSRMRRLIDHAIAEEASAVLLTCSLYAPVAHESAVGAPIPVLAADDAVFAAVKAGAYRRVVLVSSGANPLADSHRRLAAFMGPTVAVVPAFAAGAASAAQANDRAEQASSIIRCVESVNGPLDAVVLGQFSLAPAAEIVAEKLRIPVLAGPQHAVKRLSALSSREKP